MPCIKCSNGKYKYGEHGRCQYDTLKACQDVAAAIHIPKKSVETKEYKCNEQKDFNVDFDG